MAIALFTGSQFNTCVTWAGENGSSDISDQDAYVEKVLAEVEELGKTKAALDLLKEASETFDDWRIENAYRALCNSQWRTEGKNHYSFHDQYRSRLHI